MDDVSDNASFKYKTRITRGTEARPSQPARLPVPKLNIEVTIPLKYLSIFWK